MFLLFLKNNFAGLLFLNLNPWGGPTHHFQDSIVKPGFSNSRLSSIFLRRVTLVRGKPIHLALSPADGGETGLRGKDWGLGA